MTNLKEKFENNVNGARIAVGGTALTASMAAGTLTSYAADTGTTDVSTVLIDACSTMADSIIAAINGILPIAIPVVGLGLVVVIGLNVFKRVTNKA